MRPSMDTEIEEQKRRTRAEEAAIQGLAPPSARSRAIMTTPSSIKHLHDTKNSTIQDRMDAGPYSDRPALMVVHASSPGSPKPPRQPGCPQVNMTRLPFPEISSDQITKPKRKRRRKSASPFPSPILKRRVNTFFIPDISMGKKCAAYALGRRLLDGRNARMGSGDDITTSFFPPPIQKQRTSGKRSNK